MKNLIIWCKSHRTVATLFAMILTIIVLALIFGLTAWGAGMFKQSTLEHFILFGFWSSFWTILAIKANSWFQAYLIRK